MKTTQSTKQQHTPKLPREDAAYIAHTANAYPQLVEYIRSVIRATPALSDATPYEMFAFKEGRALLRELGEDA